MNTNALISSIRSTFGVLSPHLNEKARRLWAACQARELQRGGVSIVAQATGMSRVTIYVGLSELDNEASKNIQIRKVGGGRNSVTDIYPELLEQLENLIEPLTRGDPESSLRWTCKSTRNIAKELVRLGYKVTQRTVCTLLADLEYSLQSNKKTQEGNQHIDRNAQFEFIYKYVKNFQDQKRPVISVDTKKKELVGNFKNAGQEYNPKGKPTKVLCYDFPSNADGRVAPYGVYDITNNKAWVSVNMSCDTAQFAVNTIKTWWNKLGKPLYPRSKHLLITADGGGSNGSRVRLWKLELQKLANETGLTIHVCHFPPGTSKWNKIEHKLFSFITKNWRGKPLVDIATIINLISNTKTSKGLTVQAELDKTVYEKGIKVSDEELSKVQLIRNKFHGDWNYKICPKI